jgi:signal peptidase I
MAADGKGDPVSEEPHDSNRTRMTVAEAARVLHISEGAVRKRVQRGTLEHERTPDGRLIVYLDNAAISATGRERARDGSHEDRIERYLRGLEDRVEDLRNELDREREAARENKRINAALEKRIAELEAAQAAAVDPESEELQPPAIDSNDAAVVQFFITAGASIAAAAALVASVLNGQVVLAGLAGGLTLLSIGSFLLHGWLFKSSRDRIQRKHSEPGSVAPASRQEDPPGDRQAIQKKLPLPVDLLLQLLLVLALVFGFIRPFVMEAFWIPSGSMIPTLEIDDRVLVNKFIYRFTEPERGDIIVFESVDNPDEDLIKRVVGIPGDTIAEKNGDLFVNGKPQKEPYTNKNLPDSSSFAKMTIPEDHVFVMGDNRANSADSRFFGPLPEKNIEGEAFLRFWPPDRIGLL